MESLKTYFPFGPPIGYAKLPDELVDDFNKGCDDIIKSKELSKSLDHSNKLVGQVDQELLIPADIINKWGKWFGTQIRIYVAEYLDQIYHIPEQNLSGATTKVKAVQIVNSSQLTVHSAWYIRSFAGDYNPIHIHTDCELTCVGFLKVPDLSKGHKKNGKIPDGVLEILSSSGPSATAHFENDRIGFRPKVGNWYLFPANLRHLVYPFRCDGERRSFSINMNTGIFKKDNES